MSERFRPSDDARFQWLLEGALKGFVSVYGVVLQTAAVRLSRFDDTFRPENSAEGAKVLTQIMSAWNAGDSIQPWLYAEDGRYVVSDDYFWIAAVERGRPDSFAAQLLGAPLAQGIVEKVGPLPMAQVRQMLGLASR
jgi:hypothetical protein